MLDGVWQVWHCPTCGYIAEGKPRAPRDARGTARGSTDEHWNESTSYLLITLTTSNSTTEKRTVKPRPYRCVANIQTGDHPLQPSLLYALTRQ